MIGIEAEVHEIRQQVEEISKKLDILLEEHETLGIMKLSEKALYKFLDEEPDLYSVNDIKAAYR
jgi:regulator of replication initiation timing